jgi:hypothetical protein
LVIPKGLAPKHPIITHIPHPKYCHASPVRWNYPMP